MVLSLSTFETFVFCEVHGIDNLSSQQLGKTRRIFILTLTCIVSPIFFCIDATYLLSREEGCERSTTWTCFVMGTTGKNCI